MIFFSIFYMLFLIYDILDLWAGFITGITDNSNKYNKKAKEKNVNR